MPTNPLDFLNIAARYKSSDHEFERRTSIGRAYYGVYNFLLIALRKAGVKNFKDDGTDHFRMVHFLISCKNAQAAIVGNMVKNLRMDRKNADYRMDLFLDKKRAELVHDRAIKAVNEFKNLSDLPRVVEEINLLPPDPPRPKPH